MIGEVRPTQAGRHRDETWGVMAVDRGLVDVDVDCLVSGERGASPRAFDCLLAAAAVDDPVSGREDRQAGGRTVTPRPGDDDSSTRQRGEPVAWAVGGRCAR